MSDFEKALQTALQGVNEELRGASADLHQEVAAASESVSRLTNGAARLVLRHEQETPAETVYLLLLEIHHTIASGPSGNDSETEASHQYALATLHVPCTGYPISTGSDQNGGGTCAKIQDRKAISKFLTDLASRRDSPLVLYLNFHLRRQRQQQN